MGSPGHGMGLPGSRMPFRPMNCSSIASASMPESGSWTSRAASGFAASLAARRGALVSGIDASDQLVTIATARTPSGNFQAGDMFALPFADDSFDVATSFNGIWKGCEGALEEARRVLVPEGRFGVTFWGRFERLGLMPYFLKVIELSPASHGTASRNRATPRT